MYKKDLVLLLRMGLIYFQTWVASAATKHAYCKIMVLEYVMHMLMMLDANCIFKGILHLLPKISMFCALTENNQQLFEK